MTDAMLIDLMSDLDVTLLENNYMEQDVKRQGSSFLNAFLRQRNRGSQRLQEPDSLRRSVKEQVSCQKRSARVEYNPLSYETGECVRTDMSKRFHAGVKRMKKRAFAAAGVLYGAITMVLVAVSFIALLGKKKKTV